MKLVTLATIVAATAGLVASAQPHHHHHHHAQKRAPSPVEDVIVPGPTVIVYELNGHRISDQDVQEGIKNGSLIFASGTFSSVSSAPATSSSHPHHTHSTESLRLAPSSTILYSTSHASVPTSVPVTTAAPTTSYETLSRTNSTSSAEEATTSESPATTASKTYALPTEAPSSSSSSGVDTEFPDGELDCSTFPSDYGAVPLSYLGIGKWAGIQNPGSDVGGFSDILTVTSNTCSNGDCCVEGAYCSYACPPGYQKSQWPTTQGSTGQSVGGIKCQNGKLRLTNPSMARTLCIKGTSAVSVQVQNTMNQNAAVCRTDYPGTESETIPLNAAAGTTNPLTCPSASDYYTWKGMSTSAQYYVNPAGVSVEDGCQWGSPENPWGNYAPLNLGVGYSDGFAWLSIFQNSPTTEAKLDFNVELVGDNGGYDNLNGRCKYENGQFCSGNNYEHCSSTSNGCTVSVASGTATYVFSSS